MDFSDTCTFQTWPHAPVLTSQVANVLQTQGCKPALQETCLAALETLLSSCTPHAFDVALVPDLEEGALAAHVFTLLS